MKEPDFRSDGAHFDAAPRDERFYRPFPERPRKRDPVMSAAAIVLWSIVGLSLAYLIVVMVMVTGR